MKLEEYLEERLAHVIQRALPSCETCGGPVPDESWEHCQDCIAGN